MQTVRKVYARKAPQGEGESMSVVYHRDVVQGSEEWHALRCGILTASEMHLIITPTLKGAANDKEKGHLYELLAQRITQHVEPRYVSDAMLRGKEDEIDALDAYAKTYAMVETVGFLTNDKWGFTLGYSPDALVSDDGQVECKSCNQKYQIRTLVDYVPRNTIDPDFMIQVQTGLLVSERKWCDLVSYCGGLPMATVRVFNDEKVQSAIIEVAGAFEKHLNEAWEKYDALMLSDRRLIQTERKIRGDDFGGMYEPGNKDQFSTAELRGGIPL